MSEKITPMATFGHLLKDGFDALYSIVDRIISMFFVSLAKRLVSRDLSCRINNVSESDLTD